MKHLEVMIDLLKQKHEMNAIEQEALLTELMCCYISKGESSLMRFLLKKDTQAFKDKVKLMNDVGSKIKIK